MADPRAAKAAHHYNFGAAVYGSILAASLVGALLEQQATARAMTLSVAASIVALWIAHVWSDIIGERVAEGRRFRPARIRFIAIDEWPVVEAGTVPAALLALAWAGVYGRHTGVALALAAAILQLVGWGMLAGHRTEDRWSHALLLGAFDGALGVAIVAAEIAIHHI
jgi:hypothetical protein